MIFGPAHDYKVGDDAWIYIGDHQGKMSRGKVIATLDLQGFAFRHYVVAVETHIDPVLEIRSAETMRPVDPRLTRMAGLLKMRFDLDENVAETTAADLLAMVDDTDT